MPTDPARVRRTDPGDPARCPVWKFHEIYSDTEVRQWVQQGCRSAGIGCLDCKQPIIDAVLKQQAPFRERSEELLRDPDTVRAIIDEGCANARSVARDTLNEVKQVMNLVYR
jgi:tryptophanyl-tRNA synthetase